MLTPGRGAVSDRGGPWRAGRRVALGKAGPPAVVVEGFLAAGPCRQAAELAQELYEAHELLENVFQGNSWFTRVGQPDTARPADPRWAVVERLRQDVMSAVGIGRWGPDTYLRDLLSYLAPEGFVVRHRDDWHMASPEFDCRVRCNVFVQKEPGSGDPCLGPEEGVDGWSELRLGLKTGDLLVFSPSMTPHRATRVLGKAKIMLSFGLEVEEASFHEALARLQSSALPPAVRSTP